MKLSIIVPAYNEELTILTILERVKKVIIPEVEFEIIVVDDGSKDQTANLLKANPQLYSKLICMPKNGGKGAAVKAGLKSATGEFILFQDADLEYDPRDYPKIVHALMNYQADAVIGSRFLAPQLVRIHYLANRMGNKVITSFLNLLYNKTFSDVYSCYLAYRRSLIDPDCLKTFGFDQQAEILCRCLNQGKIFYEVAISYHGRDVSEGKKIKARHAFSVLFTMLRFRLAK